MNKKMTGQRGVNFEECSMNLLFLRGQVPTDRNPAEIKYNSLEKETDVWTHLAMQMGDMVEVLYWGGCRMVKYDTHKTVRWVNNFKNYTPWFEPDVIFARGGFKEYHQILKKFPKAIKIYYGAGKRYLPIKGFSDYNLTLQDSGEQLEKAKKKFPHTKHVLWAKPAAPQFTPRDVKKEFDVCYIANGGQAKIKRIPWVYKTVPRDLKVLHLGIKSKYKPPSNVTCKRVSKETMPYWINKCKVGIVPYTSYDSAPRALSEMLACGLKVATSHDLNYNQGAFFYNQMIRTPEIGCDWWTPILSAVKSNDYHTCLCKPILSSLDWGVRHIIKSL